MAVLGVLAVVGILILIVVQISLDVMITPAAREMWTVQRRQWARMTRGQRRLASLMMGVCALISADVVVGLASGDRALILAALGAVVVPGAVAAFVAPVVAYRRDGRKLDGPDSHDGGWSDER